MDAIATGKKCAQCGEQKSLDAFPRNKQQRDGRSPYCKDCKRIRDRGYYVRNAEHVRQRAAAYWQANREVILAQQREYNAAHRDEARAYRQAHVAEYRAWWAQYWDRMGDELRAKERARRAQNPEVHRQRVKDYRRAHPEAKRLIDQRRRARERGAPCTLTREEWLDILARQDYRCGGCARPFSAQLPPQMDHIIPVTHGGGLTRDNVGALCRPCNSRKHNRLIDYRTLREEAHVVAHDGESVAG